MTVKPTEATTREPTPARAATPIERAPETAPPIIEYPKMLYLGPYRMPVTVQTAEEEAIQRAAFEDPPPAKKGTR